LDIVKKSPGILIDEYITTYIKTLVMGVGSGRLRDLTMALERQELLTTVADLAIILKLCWDAQETVMHETDPVIVSKAAKEAQRLNALRNKYIRELDRLMGYNSITPLEKSY